MNSKPHDCNLEALSEKLGRLRMAHPRGVTNYYRQPLSCDSFMVWDMPELIVFSFSEIGNIRLYFYSASFANLSCWLKQQNFDRPAVIAWIGRDEASDVCAYLAEASFSLYDRFSRMNSSTLPKYKATLDPEFATEAEAELLLLRLSREFDPRTAHLPAVAGLREMARNKNIIVRRHKGTITGYIIFRVTGERVFFNYYFNESRHAADALLLLRQFFGVLDRLAIRSVHLWVQDENVRVIRLYRAFGWSFDGLKSTYFLRLPADGDYPTEITNYQSSFNGPKGNIFSSSSLLSVGD